MGSLDPRPHPRADVRDFQVHVVAVVAAIHELGVECVHLGLVIVNLGEEGFQLLRGQIADGEGGRDLLPRLTEGKELGNKV